MINKGKKHGSIIDKTTESYQLLASSGEIPPVAKSNTYGCLQYGYATGNRNGTSVNNTGTNGNYWSSTANSSNNAYNVNFNAGNLNPANNNNRNNGRCVRLAQAFTPDAAVIDFLAELDKRPHFTIDRHRLMTDLVHAYFCARKNKRRTHNQLCYEMKMEEEICDLTDKILDRTYYPDRSTAFLIEEPKLREVFAANFKDRVVHHLYYNYVYPLIERILDYDSYSCRKGKGTLFGVKRFEHHMRSCSQNYQKVAWVLKLDISGYFMNINREALLQVVYHHLIKMAYRPSPLKGKQWKDVLDFHLLIWLSRIFVMYNPVENCHIKGKARDWNSVPHDKSLFKTPAGCGLPIGNLTSQLFSNIYLNGLLQFIKRELQCSHTGHYVDDFFIVSLNVLKLQECYKRIDNYLKSQLSLSLNNKKTKLLKVSNGCDFLGFWLKPFCRFVEKSTCSRMKYKLLKTENLLDLRLMNSKRAANILVSYLGFMRHCNTYRLRKSLIMRKAVWLRKGSFNKSITWYCADII